ncbi:MAG: TonB-dependent receptor, partial [Flavobacteriales bacterium]|nr:TonB-dependent receptor [Flavobacteriales bacterium]
MKNASIIRMAVCLITMAIAGELSAQTGGIKGFVNEKDSRSPVIYTNVYFKGTTYGATTDANGFYSITRVPAGTYTLMVTFLGYDTLQEQITITPNNIITKNLFLNKSSIELRTVNISAEAQEAKTEVRMSVTQITPQKISQLPTLGGQPEFAQYLQVIPGVIFTGDQGGQLYIRGGTPVQNAILFDGMYIYNGFHSIGLFSVIDADMIRSADVYTGGFGAQFGNRISSVMDITSRDGNANRLGGKLSVSTFGAKLNLEGPLKKATPNNDASISYSLSYKNSYLDQTSKTLYNYADSNGLPFSFNDFYGKVSFNSGQGSKIDLSGFHFSDNANYANGTKINWRNYGGGGKF